MKRSTMVVLLVGLISSAAWAGSPSQVQYAFESFGLGGGGYLGVHLRDVGPDDVSDLGLGRERGVYIEEVVEGSPAEEAGIQSGDVIVAFSGIDVLSVRQFQRLVSDTPPGRRAEVRLVRGGATQSVEVEVGGSKLRAPRAQQFDVPELTFDPERFRHQFRSPELHWFGEGSPLFVLSGRPQLGIRGEPLTEQMAEFLGVAKGEGVLIMEVLEDSPAEKAGLRAGDVIIKVGDSEIATVQELSSKLKADGQTLTIVRNKQTETVEVELEAPKRRIRTGGRGIRM